MKVARVNERQPEQDHHQHHGSLDEHHDAIDGRRLAHADDKKSREGDDERDGGNVDDRMSQLKTT